MKWSDLKPWVSKLAPMLGTALGGPLGGAAGALLGEALGTKDATPESIQAAIKTGSLNGDQILALKKAEEDFSIQMAKMGFDSAEALAELEFKDRDSARNREIQVKDYTPAIGFYLITAGFFGLLAALLKWNVPEANKAVIYTMVGSLGTAWVACVGYYYGSSAGSKNKDTLIFNSTPTDGTK